MRVYVHADHEGDFTKEEPHDQVLASAPGRGRNKSAIATTTRNERSTNRWARFAGVMRASLPRKENVKRSPVCQNGSWSVLNPTESPRILRVQSAVTSAAS